MFLGRKNSIKKRGRPLYVLRNIENQRETQPDFRKYMKKSKENWINIGYYRKSPSKETTETHKRLLLLMSNRLISKCLCKKSVCFVLFTSKGPIIRTWPKQRL